MAGGRKGRRKPGHGGPGENEAARDGQNPMAAKAGREKAAETRDIEAEQWLNPFRIGRPVTPVISHRQNVADPSAPEHSHGLPRGEPIRAVPVQAVPVEDMPVQGVPVQIWHDPPPDEIWQQGQRPMAEPEREDGRDPHRQPWAARGDTGGYKPGNSAVHGNDYGPQAYYMDVPDPGRRAYPARGYHGGGRSAPDEHGQSVRYGAQSEYVPGEVYRGRDGHLPGRPGREEGYSGHQGYQGYGPGDGHHPGDGYGRHENYAGYPPPAYGPQGGYGPPRGYGPPSEYGPPGSDRRRGRSVPTGRDPGQGDHDPGGRFVPGDSYGPPDSYGSPAGYVRRDDYGPHFGYGRSGGPAGLPPDGPRERHGPGYGADDTFAPDFDAAPPPRYGSPGYVRERGSGAGNRRDQRAGYGPPGGYRGRSGHGPADDYGPDPGYGPATGYGQAGPRAPVPPDQYGWRDRGRADYGDRGQSPRRERQGYGPNDAQAGTGEPWRGDMRRPVGPGMPGDPVRQRPQADSAWDGRSRQRDGYGRQSRPQSAPGDSFWGPRDAVGYEAGGVQRGYDRRLRAAYGPGDPFPRGQRRWRDPSAGTASGRGRDDLAAGQRPRPGASAGPARKTALPAALPPGSSETVESGNTTGTPRVHSDPAAPAGTAIARLASGSEGTEPAPLSVTAATPPSPTGTVPPAASTLLQPVRVGDTASADTAGYDVVSPDAETTPMAIILGDRPATSVDSAAPSHELDRRVAGEHSAGQRSRFPAAAIPSAARPRMRGPFEPANNLAPPPAAMASPRSGVQVGSASGGSGAGVGDVAGSRAGRDASDRSEPSGSLAGSAASAASASTAKMDQIKDLYLAAEAIGEDALDRNFQLVSDRQRQLIREYFDQAVPGGADTNDTAS